MSTYDDAREIVERGAVPSARGLAPKFAQALIDLVKAAELCAECENQPRYSRCGVCRFCRLHATLTRIKGTR